MKIEDSKTFYQFLGDLHWGGAIVIVLLVSLIFAFLTVTISEKIIDEKAKIAKGILTASIFIITIICGVTLKVESDNDKDDLLAANAIKSYLIVNNQQYKSLEGLANEVQLSVDDPLCNGSSGCIKNNVKRIKALIKKFPSEFIYCSVDENVAKEGLGLIDEQAEKKIDSANAKLLPFFVGKVVYYMHLPNKNPKISFREFQDSVDARFYPDLLEKVVSSSKGKLVVYTEMQANQGQGMDFIIMDK